MSKDSLGDRIYHEVKQDIRDGKIGPSDCIVENDLCRQYEISKATAGEVLHRLTQEGLLKSYPRKGYKLNVYSKDDLKKIQDLRFAIETLVIHKLIEEVEPVQIREAFKNLEEMDNITFHTSLGALLEDDFIDNTLDNLLTRARITYENIVFDDDVDQVVHIRHRAIIDALAAGREEEALDALRTDLRIDAADDPLKGLGLWKIKKTFTTEDMGKIVYQSDPQISPTGKTVAVVEAKAKEEDGVFYPEIVLCSIKTGEAQKLLGGGKEKNPRFAPDGRYLAYLSDRSGEFQIYVRYEDGRDEKITSLRHGVKSFSVAPDGKSFLFEADLWKEEIEGGLSFCEMSAEEKQDWLSMREWAPMEITQIDYKRDESKGVRDGSVSLLGTADLGGEQKLYPSDFPCFTPSISPDGRKIAFYGQPHTGAKFSAAELFVMDVDGGNQKRLTDGASLSEDAPAYFTEDGAYVVYPAYYGDDQGNTIQYLYKIKTEGGEPVCLFDPEAQEVSSGVYGTPLCRTQFGQEKPYYQIRGEYAYFLCAWKGTERLYRISLKGKSVPEPLLSGDFSIHEFCLPVDGLMVLTRGDFETIRTLYQYNIKAGTFLELRDPNPWLKEYSLGQITAMEVKSKDKKAVIHGMVCRPANFKEGRKYPAVLYIHGGPTVCYTNDFWHEIHLLANAGYAVVYCDPRGSFGYGLKFCNSEESWGQEAYDDLMHFLDEAISLGFIDPERVGITGGSYGGYMTCKIVMMTDRFKAAVGQRIFVNKATSYGTGDVGFYSASRDWSKVNIKDCLIERARTSIIKDMDRINTPMLLLHGYQDYRCSFEQSEQMFISMKERRADVPVRLVMFPGENHNVSRTGLLHFQKRHVKEMIDWFDRYLKEGSNE